MKPLAGLVGKWEGNGKGSYPTIKSFDYKECLFIESIGQPNFSWTANSFINDQPKHRESGFLKLEPNETRIALLLAENTGIVSNYNGKMLPPDSNSVEKGSELWIELVTETISGTPFNKLPSVTKVKRVIFLRDEDTLVQHVFMSTTTTETLNRHLEITYNRAA